jgi:hypothetical protein
VIQVHIKLSQFLTKAPIITRKEWLSIGAKAVETIKQRLSYGIGSDDRKMKKLTPAYAKRKKKIGQPAIRNLMFSNSMQGAMGIVGVTENSVLIGFTRRSEVTKAAANEKRSPWYGLSRKDQNVVSRFAANLVRARA